MKGMGIGIVHRCGGLVNESRVLDNCAWVVEACMGVLIALVVGLEEPLSLR